MVWLKKPSKDVKTGIKGLYPRLWRYCLMLSGNTHKAEDLAQSTCLRALEKSTLFEDGTELDRWVFKIAQRTWFNELRAESVRLGGGISTIEDVELCDNAQNPESTRLLQEILTQVLALPEAQRIAVGLVYIEEYTYKEAAEIMEVPIGTVMSRLSAARRFLAKRLKQNQSSEYYAS